MRSKVLAMTAALLLMSTGCPTNKDDDDNVGVDGGEPPGKRKDAAPDDGDAGDGSDAGSALDASGNAVGDGATGDAASPEAGPEAGAQESAGVVTFDTVAFFNPALTTTPDGTLHLVYNLNNSPSQLHYARCTDDCGVGSNWDVAVIATSQYIGAPRIVAGSDNRLHVLYEPSSRLVYTTCASNCGEPANWTSTELGSLFGGGWNSPDYGSPLAIDAQNRLYFTVDRSTYLHGGLTLATCGADCSDLSNWQAGYIGTGFRTALAARGTTLHQIVGNATTSTAATALSYRTCSSNCTSEASWQTLQNVFAYDGSMPNAIVVTAEGGVRVAYNQGVSAAGESASVKAQDGKMLFWSCDGNCLQKESWSGLMMGEVNDGHRGIAMAELNGGLVLAVANGDRVFAKVCEQNCLMDSSWQQGDVDTSAAMAADYDPFAYTGATCNGERPVTAGWNLVQPAVAIRPSGAIAFAHVTSMLRTCTTSTQVVYIPGLGRAAYWP